MFKRWMIVFGVAVALALPALGLAQEQEQNKVTVSLTAPANNTVVTAPGTVALTAAASASLRNWAILRVEFYQGATLIGSATAAPYTITWTNAPAGTYTLTAKAIATNRGQSKDKDHRNSPAWEAVSAPVSLTVNAPPTVSLASPTTSQAYIAPASVTLTANATDSDGTVAKVEFYQGSTLIGTATAAPYTATWQNAPAGTYKITAKATDDKGATTISAPVQISIDAPPTISLTSPTAGQAFIAPASVTLTANAADADGTVAKVEFYQGATLIGAATAAPYTATWQNAPAGTYTLTAKATDDKGATTTSAAVIITVLPNQLPSITLAGPTAGQRFTASATISLEASAQDVDGQIARVEFYQGATLIGTATAVPYIATWQNVPEGQYSLSAKAIDNGGGETFSSAVSITVGPAGLKVYYLHSDHLNTPRIVTDEQNRIVWRNSPLAEPFGTAAPEQDPDGDGIPFTLNLRFPGQYYDKETGLSYNYFRDYNPETGRYVQSDPIGLLGGLNTYTYVGGNPASKTDPMGLLVCGAAGSFSAYFIPDYFVFLAPPSAANFTPACQWHDDCYGKCGASKVACDTGFYSRTVQQCRTMVGGALIPCLLAAQTYYEAVNNLGGSAYDAAQKKCKGCQK